MSAAAQDQTLDPMFSSRFTWSFTANRLSKALDAKRAAGIPVLDLTESNPTRAGFEYPESEMLAAMALPASMRYDPDPRGLLVARQAVADYYAGQGLATSPDAIHLTAGTSEGYAYLLKLLADPGDEVLVPQPSYPLFDFLAALESVNLVRYPLEYDEKIGWRIQFDQLAAMISTKTRAIVLVNPNNPTGSFVKKPELEKLNELCARERFALIVDEVFSDYGFGNDPQRIRSMAGNDEALTFVLSGLSKIAGLPQMKLGWIHTSGPEKLFAEARERLDFIADTYLSVGTAVQHMAAELLSLRHGIQQQILQRVDSNRTFLEAYLAKAGRSRMLRIEGGWYAILEIPAIASEEEWALSLLEESNVFVHPGYFFDFAHEGFIVVSLLTSQEIFREGIARIIDHLE
jgi:aspartate/methionine/tyrosine aminotransferase